MTRAPSGSGADHGQADRHVDEEDPLPREQIGDDAAEEQADGGATRRDRAPDAECLGALGAFGERTRPRTAACRSRRPCAGRADPMRGHPVAAARRRPACRSSRPIAGRCRRSGARLGRRQCDVGDRRVEDHHELGEADHDERPPGARGVARIIDDVARRCRRPPCGGHTGSIAGSRRRTSVRTGLIRLRTRPV